MTRLTPEAARAHLQRLAAWQYHADAGGRLSRTFEFASFAQAFAFMTEVALWAERHDHHPDWRNVHRRVEVTLTTHDVQGLSLRDVDLAAHMDALHARLAAQPTKPA
jgi:4a-hydroxytetrahydrobiopterin dehydratase